MRIIEDGIIVKSMKINKKARNIQDIAEKYVENKWKFETLQKVKITLGVYVSLIYLLRL